jgi:hypothetical protein
MMEAKNVQRSVKNYSGLSRKRQLGTMSRGGAPHPQGKVEVEPGF